jgi:hypothetical protein
MNDRIELWEKLFHQHRFTEMAVLLAEALRIGLQKGSVTAEDLHHIPVVNPSVRGAVMKALRRGGLFESVGFKRGTTDQSHGHIMQVWMIIDRPSASKILRFYSDSIAGCQGNKVPQQLEML